MPFVAVTPAVTEILTRTAPRFENAYATRSKRAHGPAEIRSGVGDVLTITLFEAAAGGLIIPLKGWCTARKFHRASPQQVDNRGNTLFPYAGAIRAAGRTAVELQDAIVDALKDQALRPQAIVSLTDQRASSVSVLGEGGGGGGSLRFPLSASGERVLDAIARAGISAQGYDLWVMLERRGRRETLPFGALVYHPVNNVFLTTSRYDLSLPSTADFPCLWRHGSPSTNPVEAWRISLAEATGKAGGLLDAQADPGSVFIYRGETRELAESARH